MLLIWAPRPAALFEKSLDPFWKTEYYDQVLDMLWYGSQTNIISARIYLHNNEIANRRKVIPQWNVDFVFVFRWPCFDKEKIFSMLEKKLGGKSQLQKCLMTPWQTQCYWKTLVFLSLESQPVVLVLKTFFYFLSGSLSLMLSLAESIWYWNGFQQPLTQRIWIRSVIQDKSSTSALDEWTLARFIIDSFLWLQVLQFYSRQSYQNKAVPSAGLLFVFIEQANGLPVSIISSMNTVMSGAISVFTGTCYC